MTEAIISAAICCALFLSVIFYIRKEYNAKLEMLKDSLRSSNKDISVLLDGQIKLRREHEQVCQRLKALESGAVPDYEAQKAAKAEVDAFNIGITSILSFDPFEARRKAREEHGGGSE